MVKRKDLLKTFLDLVKIDSPSGEEGEVADYILRHLGKEKIKAARDRYGNVIAVLPGRGRPLLLATHMDTVEPGRGIKPVVKKNTVRSDGRTVLGADDKAGVAVVLETVACLRRRRIEHRPLELIFTREEEAGLKGAYNLNYRGLRARQAVTIDSPGPIGQLTVAVPYIYEMDIIVRGRAAHAGAEPEKGSNAIAVAARAIADLKIGRVSPRTTNNIGLITGGTAVNSVPAEATVRAEARSHKQKEAQAQVDLFNRAFKKAVRRARARLVFRTALICRGYELPRTDKFVGEVAAAHREAGARPFFHRSGGATDANVFAAHGIKTVDIAYGGGHAHTTREYVSLSDLARLAGIMIRLVKIK